MFYRKRLLSILITLTLLMSVHIGYASTPNLEEIGVKLKALGLMVGDDKGNMNFETNITRVEFAAIAVRLVGKDSLVPSKQGKTTFKDVPLTHWGTGYINVATENGLIHGYADGNFYPNKNINYGEALTIMINALGYRNDIIGKPWPQSVVSKAADLGITKGLQFQAAAITTRGEIAQLLNNSLTVIVK